MAFMWEAVSAKEIADQCRMESKRVSADLNTLTDRKIVETIATDKRTNLYRISERFFNMWLIVTQGNPDQKRKARWMSEFLESWYDKHELQNMALQHIEDLETGKVSGKDAIVLSKGLSQSRYISIFDRDKIIDLTKAELKDSHNSYWMQLPETVEEILDKMENCIEQKKYQQAIKLANSIENEEDGWKEILLGCVCAEEKKYSDTEKYFLRAMRKGNTEVIFFLALAYYKQNINKGQAKQYIEKYEGTDIAKIIIEIWAGIFNNIEERAITVCREKKEDADFIEHLLIQHQKSLVDKLFHHVEFGKRLQEQYAVLYYASQILNGKENENNLRLRIPPELQTTVDDVLKNIKSEQERYAK